MKFDTLNIIFLLIFGFKSTRSEIYSAVHELQKHYENEEKIIRGLENFVENLSKVIESIERKKNEMQKFHQDIGAKGFDDPLNAFLLIKMATFDLKQIEQMILSQISLFMEQFGNFATENDLSGAVEGILRLQNFYKIKSSEIADGYMNGIKMSEKLSSEALNLIAVKAHENGEDNFAQEFWNLSLLEVNDDKLKDEIFLNLAKSFQDMGKFEEALDILEKLLKKDASNVSAFLLQENIHQLKNYENKKSFVQSRQNVDYFETNGVFDSKKEEILYRKACRGELMKHESETKHLRCFYYSTSSFSLLARFKAEELNLIPRIVLFHDVLSDTEIKNLSKISKNSFHRSKTYDREAVVSKDRVSQISWIKSEKTVINLDKRLKEMTGLSMESAEDLQIQSYGIGGHYSLHYDHRLESQTPFELGTGNRIASVLLYLSDVESGGATVFPFLKVIVPPKKGSALFWFNLKTSGVSDYLTRHAGCPVLKGSKLVANKWIHEVGQNLQCTKENYGETLIDFREALNSFF